MPRESAKRRRSRRPVEHIPAGEFKAKCLELMDRVHDQCMEYVVTKRGRPVAKLVPVDDDEAPTAVGSMRGTVLWYGDIVSPDFGAWQSSESDPPGRG